MAKFFWAIPLIFAYAHAQVVTPAASAVEPQPSSAVDHVASSRPAEGKVSLVRGVVKRVDPVHDQLLIRVFGGGDVRIAFDPRTQFVSETSARLTSIPAGSVVAVDTAIEGGKLFARAVRTGSSATVELNGQVVRYDAAKSQLTMRDPASPENISLRVTPSTTVVDRGQPASPQVLSTGMLVQVWFSPQQKTADRVEIVAEPGNSFTFAGRIIAVDLRSRILTLSNDWDRSIREIAIGSQDATTLALLRDGAEVNIQAEFDGDHYNARAITPVSTNP